MKLPDAAFLIASFMTEEPLTDGRILGAEDAMTLLIDYSRGELSELSAMRLLIAAQRDLRRTAAGTAKDAAAAPNAVEVEDDWVEHRNWTPPEHWDGRPE